MAVLKKKKRKSTFHDFRFSGHDRVDASHLVDLPPSLLSNKMLILILSDDGKCALELRREHFLLKPNAW